MQDGGLMLGMLIGGAATVAAVSFVPPLTQWEAPQRSATAFTVPEGVMTDYGKGYCEAQLSGVNCECFSHTAREVLTAENPARLGISYADGWELARVQASDSCS